MIVYILDEKGVDLCNSGLPLKPEDESTLPEAVIIVYNPRERGQ